VGRLRGCVHRTGERWAVSAVRLGTVVEGGPGPPSRFEGGLGLVRPNVGAVRDKNWCFLMVSRALLTERGEGKYVQVQNNNTSWKTQ